MATPATDPVGPDTFVTVKVHYNDANRRFKVQLRDLGARVFPQTLRQLLALSADANVVFERYSDSAGSYVRLDSENIAVYKQLYRAAKAKLKLRIKATVLPNPASETESKASVSDESKIQQTLPRCSYLDTVLSPPLPSKTNEQYSSFAASAPSLSTDDTRNAVADLPPQQCSTAALSTEPGHTQSLSALSVPAVSHMSPTGVFCIDCNNCGRSVQNEHYHCSICEKGDFDLCLSCVDEGVSCPGTSHWLIKRCIQDGIVTTSVTETVAPRSKSPANADLQTSTVETVPAPAPEKVKESPSSASPLPTATEERICNSCLKDFDESKMVNCVDCDDYDLCMTCLLKDAHGHHPAHTFKLIRDRQFCLKSLVLSRCNPGRHHQHAAICDGCDKRIIGVRHKCLICPDWDYCSDCMSTARQEHPGHRFVPIYEALAEPPSRHEVHYGIFCDGPLCKNKASSGYITGTRYKCAVCHDADFCANCEALPSNTHNRTHPLIKFRTPVRSVTVTTVVADDGRSEQTLGLGDRIHRSAFAQAASLLGHGDGPMESVEEKGIKTEVEPSAVIEQSRPAFAVEEDKANEQPAAPPLEDSQLQAFFIRDTVPDGSMMPPDTVFQQTWTLYNPGPHAWPVGSHVRFVGGDPMLILDTAQPFSNGFATAAVQSNELVKPVEAGQSAPFTVTLKSPSREGIAISYWRLKLPSGVSFGHRLWCDINVMRVRQELAKVEPCQSEVKEPGYVRGAAPEMEDLQEVARSKMIFPTLEKESPSASTHEAITPEAAAPAAPSLSENDILEDVENLTLGDATTEDGFLTDEEYEVLGASDQEYQEANK